MSTLFRAPPRFGVMHGISRISEVYTRFSLHFRLTGAAMHGMSGTQNRTGFGTVLHTGAAA